MRYALVSNGVVEGVYNGDDSWAAANPQAIALGNDPCGPGWLYTNGAFSPPPTPPTPVPVSVTMRQARLALLQQDLLDDVETAINALPQPQQSAARIEWEYSNEVQRTNGFVEQIAPALGLTSQGLDELFILAATL